MKLVAHMGRNNVGNRYPSKNYKIEVTNAKQNWPGVVVTFKFDDALAMRGGQLTLGKDAARRLGEALMAAADAEETTIRFPVKNDPSTW